MSRSIVIFDLDHGLLTASPAKLVAQAMRAMPDSPAGTLDAAEQLHRLADRTLGPVVGDVLVRGIARVLDGTPVSALRDAGRAASTSATDLVAPHANPLLAEHRGAGRRIVLTTYLPERAAAPIADALNADALVATTFAEEDGKLTGTVEGPVVWGRGKLEALRSWCALNDASLKRSYAYAGSIHDAPLLAEVRNPIVVDPDAALAGLAWLKGWPTRSLRAPAGVATVAGREIQDLLRPLSRPGLMPNARFEFHDLEHIPDEGPAIVCGNHRSYFDASAVGLAIMQRGRTARFLGKKEVFDAPLVGAAARWAGGIRVDRGTGSDEPLRAAATALEAGDLIMLMPQGTIPRGPAFFDPELKGRWGAARLAAMTKSPVIPLGIWGTEKVWPRSSRLPNLNPFNRPLVTVRAGPPVDLTYGDPDADTQRIMSAIADLLPEEAREHHEPTPEELARTYPHGYKGDPEAEDDRRPGTDT